MSESSFDYPRILQRALRSVVREVLARTAAEGLPGEHHFYLSLRTDHPRTSLPAFLRERYPQEITIVLQHQFWDLAVDERGFGVTLLFDGERTRLEAPYEAVVAFFDPAAQFGLRFDLAGLGGATGATTGPGAPTPPLAPPEREPPASDGPADPAAQPVPPRGPGEGKVLSFERPRDRKEPE